MKKILILIMLLIPSVAMAGTIELGFNEIHYGEIERDYHVGISDEIGIISLNAEYNYGKIGNIVHVDDARLSIGYDPILNEKWSLWFDETVAYDKPGGVEVENLLGAGPKYTFYKSDVTKASISFGYLYHYQSLFNDVGATEHKSVERWSLRLKYKRHTTQTKIDFIVFYQPVVNDSEDYITFGEASYSIILTDFVDLKLSIKNAYRSIVPDGQENNKLNSMVMIIFKFK